MDDDDDPPFPVSTRFTVDLCMTCPHLHFTFYDGDDVICGAVITKEQLLKAAEMVEARH